jgi:ABC-type glycerol-3-phosphate transport system substrate-binding protein
LAGLDYADIVWAGPHWVLSPYITSEIAIPLDEYLDFDSAELKIMKGHEWGYFLGKHYIMSNLGTSSSSALIYNKDIFGRDNLEDPFELQQKGQWTWAKFLEIARAATKRDTNGNVTQWGVVTTTGADFMLQICASNDTDGISYDGTSFKVTINDKKTIEAYEFMKDIVVDYKCGLLTELVGDATERGERKWKNGTVAMCFSTRQLAKQYSPENCGMVICPKGPSASGYLSPAFAFGYMVPATSKIPEAAAKIMYDVFARWDTDLPGAYDEEEIENLVYGIDVNAAYCENDLVTMKLITQNPRFMQQYRFISVQNEMLNQVYSDIAFKNIPVATAVDEDVNDIQTFVDLINEDLEKLMK